MGKNFFTITKICYDSKFLGYFEAYWFGRMSFESFDEGNSNDYDSFMVLPIVFKNEVGWFLGYFEAYWLGRMSFGSCWWE